MSEQPDSKLSLPHPPFNAHDFFGILIPGACFIISVYLFEGVFASLRASHGYHDLFFHWLAGEVHPYSGVVEQAALFILGVIGVYVTGQVIAAISSLFMDRILVFKGYGYPFEFLLFSSNTSPKKNASRNFYRGSVFWLNLWIIFWVCLKLKTDVHLSGFKWFLITIPFLLTVTVKPIVHGLFDKKDTFNKGGHWGKLYHIFNNHKDLIYDCLHYYAMLYNVLGHFIENFINTHRAIEDGVTEKYIKYFEDKFQLMARTANSDNYWFSLFYIINKDKKIYDRVCEWYQISSFARNLATAFYLAYLYSVLAIFLKTEHVSSEQLLTIQIFLGGLLVLSCIMAIRFYHCFVGYYSKGLYRAFVCLSLIEEYDRRTVSPPPRDTSKF